jgi:hypothetical protein
MRLRLLTASASGSAQQQPRWLFFNDEKVALSEAPPWDLGYIYVFAGEGEA